jgi:hypothetical protein
METDGFVPRSVVRQFDPKLRTVGFLVDAGLWVETADNGEPGWQFHDWSDIQLTREEIAQFRRSKAEAGRRGGRRSGEVRRSKAEARASEAPGSKSNLEPEPEPIATDVAIREPRKRGTTTSGTRIPDDFTVTPEMVAWAHEHAPHVDGRAETARFVDYWRAKAGKDGLKRDWPATWRNWMRTAEERSATRRPTNGHHRPTADDKIAAIQAMKHRGGPALPPGNGS